jgi:hypothetical protein
MAEKADDPKAQSTPETPEPPPDFPKRRPWPLPAGVVALALIGFGAFGGIGACTDPDYRGCVTDHLQHAFAILSTVTAALASFRQGRTAKTKSVHHGTEWRKETNETLKGAHAYDFHHFKRVSFWWYTVFVGAVAAVVAEFIDWWGKPLIDLLLK